jgi:hypothetical protein
MMQETPTFERKLQFLLDCNRSETPSGFEMSEIYPLLGCRYLAINRTPGSASHWEVFEAAQPEEKYENVVTAALVDVMRVNEVTKPFAEGFFILDGLSRQRRWRACLLTMDDAHDLSVLLAQYSVCSRKSMSAPLPGMFLEMHPAILAVLNEWTTPETPYTDFPELSALACALYGNAWVDLCVPEKCETDDFRRLVRSMRPPFLPGLVAADSAGYKLPEIAFDTP